MVENRSAGNSIGAFATDSRGDRDTGGRQPAATDFTGHPADTTMHCPAPNDASLVLAIRTEDTLTE
jgi:hypothetical protein